MNFNRRDLLKIGGAGLSAGLLGSTARATNLMNRSLSAFALNPDAQLCIIFLRGANDGVHTTIPIKDPTYQAARGSIAFAANDPTLISIPRVNFSKLHRAFARINGSAGPLKTGQIAWLHQVGNQDGERSHFTEQQITETGDPQPVANLNPYGFVGRMVEEGRIIEASQAGANWDRDRCRGEHRTPTPTTVRHQQPGCVLGARAIARRVRDQSTGLEGGVREQTPATLRQASSRGHSRVREVGCREWLLLFRQRLDDWRHRPGGRAGLRRGPAEHDVDLDGHAAAQPGRRRILVPR